MDGSGVDLYFLEGYYDYEDPTNPIKDKQTYEYQELSYGWKTMWYQTLKQNYVVYLNGTNSTFYSLGKRNQYFEPSSSETLQISIWIDSEYDVYEQYEIDQPDPISRRNLNTSTVVNDYTYSYNKVDEIDKQEGLLGLFFIIAQIGGLYAFAKLALSIVLGCYQNKKFNHDSVNKYNQMMNKRADPMDDYQQEFADQQEAMYMKDVDSEGDHGFNARGRFHLF